MSNRFTKAALLTGTFMAGALAASPVYAQTNDADDATDQDNAIQAGRPGTDEVEGNSQGIVVTGSRIVRRNLETAAPIAVVQDEEFKLTGAVNVENVINALPQVVPGFTSASNNPGNGAATVDLRGLGTTRTLVLVNGRRYMFFDTSQVTDLNTIPSFLLDSVDVVTGGASAVYGSDAIAGVVNFRLRNVEGAEVGGQYNITEEGDGRRYEVFGALGSSFGDGRGHATVYAEYYRRAGIFANQRPRSAATLGDDGNGGFAPGGSPTTPNGGLQFSGTGNRAGTAFATNGSVFFDTPGTFRPLAGDLFNYGAVNYLQIPQERYLLGGFADYDVGGGHTFYTEVSFVNNLVQTQLAATPVTGTFNVRLATVQPFLSAGSFAQLQQLDRTETGAAGNDGIVRLFVRRRVNETGGRINTDERNAFRVLGGVRGPITNNFSYDAYYSFARTRNSNLQDGNISRSAFQRGLDGTGTAINIFGPGTLTPAQVDAISIRAQNGETSSLQVVNAAISGSLFNLGMGGDDVGIAFGGEYRKVASSFIPDTALSSGDVIGFNGGLPTSGSYDVKEAFGEIRIPIASGSPGLYDLELTGAVRYSDYSLANVGGVFTYAGGIQYSPIPDITFRGQYQRAVRAPNVEELFGGLGQGFPGAADPCSDRGDPANRTAAVRALCIASGVPAAAVFTRAVQPATQIEGLFGGNPNLQEEVSDSYTAGVVFRPSFVPRLAVTLDYYNIEVRGAIGTLGGGLNNALNLCFNVAQNINSPFCQVFLGTRDPAGFISDVNPPQILNANTARREVEGVDLQVDYSTPFGFSMMGGEESKLNFYFLGTYTRKFDLTPVEALPDEINECAGRFGQLACGDPIPKYKLTSRLSWIDGPLTTSLRWRHLSSTRDDDDGTDYTVERLRAYNIFDLALSFDITEEFTFAVGANNLLNKKPQPIGDNQQQTNTYPSTFDTLGRDFFASVRFQF